MKKVLITGGNKGIGLSTTIEFLENGYFVFVLARNFDNFTLRHENLQAISYDLTHIDGIPSIYNLTGDIDILINNAGVMYSLPYNNYPKEHKNSMLAINLESQIELIKLYSPSMIAKKSGRIVNNASIAGEIGHPDIWYGITKSGVINITKSFARILGGDGIVVNCVAAGPVETDLLQTIPIERRETIKNTVFTKRFAQPDEVAKTMYWLGTECPEYINGTCIDINNGAFMR